MHKQLFDQLLSDEPLMQLSIETALADGSRQRTRNRVVRGGAVGTGLALVAVGILVLPSSSHTATPVASKPPHTKPDISATSLAAYQSAVASGAHATAPNQTLADLVTANSPAGFTFNYDGPRTEDNSLDGTVNDGTVPGQFYLVVDHDATPPGFWPCDSDDAANGITCAVTTDAQGNSVKSESWLQNPSTINSQHRIINAKGKLTSVDVSVSLPDGRTVLASASNFVFPDIPTPVPGAKPGPVSIINLGAQRPAPAYTVDQLTTLVEAVAHASF